MRTRQPRPLKSLDRVLSKAGLGSRTEARVWIAAGRVSVDGRSARDPERRIDASRARVCLDGEPIATRDRLYLLLHKPAGYVTTYRDPEGRPTVYDLIAGVRTFVAPVGRLDRDTSGLLLMTNDHQFADRVTSPGSHVPKTYVVTCSRRLADDDLEQLRGGVLLRDGRTRPARVIRADDDAVRQPALEITITEGRNRQVRRMIEAVGAKVVALTRVRIGSLSLGDVPPGGWRHLTAAEIAALER